MVKHLVSWNFKPEVSPEKRAEVAKNFNDRLQAIKRIMPGVAEINVIAHPHSTSTVDIVLDSTFESAEVLAAYQVHPDHVAAGVYVKEYFCNRTCCDYDI